MGMDYVWCTPGTKTYTFFALKYLTPPPLDYMSFGDAISATLASLSNQADMAIPDGQYTSDPAGFNVQVYVENSNKGKVTYGILNSALTGLSQFLTAYHNNDPIIFQVNDGQWGEVGRGYAGFLRPSDGKCLLQIYQGKEEECSRLNKDIA